MSYINLQPMGKSAATGSSGNGTASAGSAHAGTYTSTFRTTLNQALMGTSTGEARKATGTASTTSSQNYGARTISTGSALILRSQIGSVSKKSTLGNLAASQAYLRQQYQLQNQYSLPEDWAGTKPTAGTGGTGESEASQQPLPAARSSWAGGYFTAPEVTIGQREAVGEGIYQFHNPHFVQKDGTVYAYFIDHSDGSLNDVGLATSTDGVNFEYQGKVLTKSEDGFDANKASFPCVQYDGETGQWYMLYEATSATGDVDTVSLATSSDGINWERKGPVINPGDAGWISNVDVGTPTMFKEDGTWHVYFHTFAYEDARVRVGYASGPELDQLTVKDGAILDVEPGGNETVTVGARSRVFKSGDYYYMAYEVSNGDNYDFSTHQWGINLARATSPDGPWEKKDGSLLVASAAAGFGPDGPEILETDEGTYLYFRNQQNNTERVRLYGV